MPKKVITRLAQVNSQWLTAVLTESGALVSGAVSSFDVARGKGNFSTSARLALQYAAGSTGDRPQQLFLKLVKADQDDESFGRSEVDYYTRDYVGVAGVPLVRAYDAAFSANKKRYHLLLDDLTDTHLEASQKTPTLAYGLALAEGLAAMHAHWWGAERLAETGAKMPGAKMPGAKMPGAKMPGAKMPGAKHIRRFVDIAEPGCGHIINEFAAELKPQWPNLMRDLFANHPLVIIERAKDANGFTLIHGDAGHNNILVPREGDRPIYLIDRQPFNWSLTTWLGVYDLAYAMVLDWYVEVRRRLELPVLRHYHEELVRHGVSGYSWEQLYEDYRLTAAMGVYVAAEYNRGGINKKRISAWLPMLQRALTACDDLDCRALW